MKKRILVVEETPGATRPFVDALVRDRRYDVRTASAGPGALCRAHEFSPHLVIADAPGSDDESLKVARTLGWVNAVPSVVLSEAPGPAPEDLPAVRRVLARSCDDETLLRTVEELI